MDANATVNGIPGRRNEKINPTCPGCGYTWEYIGREGHRMGCSAVTEGMKSPMDPNTVLCPRDGERCKAEACLAGRMCALNAMGIPNEESPMAGSGTGPNVPARHNESTLPTDAKARKALPIFSGVLNYFPNALLEVAHCSKVGNDQHNPGQPLHWAKGKSTDHEDALVRHLLERGTVDTDGVRHSAKVAWRALALLETEIEKEKELAAQNRS